MKWLLILLVIAQPSCSKELKPDKHLYIESEFQPYVLEFEDAAKSFGRPMVIDNLIVEFHSVQGGATLADCGDGDRGTKGTPNVHVSRVKWSRLSYLERRWVIFHELGHCVLWLEHDERMININGYLIGRSIMYPYLQAKNIYADHWDYYIHELFVR